MAKRAKTSQRGKLLKARLSLERSLTKAATEYVAVENTKNVAAKRTAMIKAIDAIRRHLMRSEFASSARIPMVKLQRALEDVASGTPVDFLSPSKQKGHPGLPSSAVELRIAAAVSIDLLMGEGQSLQDAARKVAEFLRKQKLKIHSGRMETPDWQVVLNWRRYVRAGKGRQGKDTKTRYEKLVAAIRTEDLPIDRVVALLLTPAVIDTTKSAH